MSDSRHIPGQKVLIVEDDGWLAHQQSRALERADFVTRVSPHAAAAMVEIDDFRPDVIVLDVLLTGNTGFTLLHELQSYGDTGQIPIILSTSLASEINLEDVKPYGVKRILDKATMKPDTIVAAVRSVL